MSKKEFLERLNTYGVKAEINKGTVYILNVTDEVADRLVKEIGWKYNYGVKRDNTSITF